MVLQSTVAQAPWVSFGVRTNKQHCMAELRLHCKHALDTYRTTFACFLSLSCVFRSRICSLRSWVSPCWDSLKF